MKKTYFSIPLILLITFLFAFSLPVDAGSKKSSKGQPADLDLRNVKVHRNNKSDTYITFKIKNRSEVTAPDYHTVVAIGPFHGSSAHGRVSIPVSGHAGSPGSGSPFVGTISVGNPVRSFTVNTEDLPVGDHDVRVLIYWGPDTGNDSNINWAWIQKDVSYRKVPSEGLPDLKLKNVQRSNNNSPNTSISFTVKNVGSAPAPAYRIGYRLGATHIPHEVRVGSISDEFSAWSVYGLEVGQEHQFSVAGQLPDGNHYLEMFVDSNEQIVEEREDNNRKVKKYTKIPAGGLPDLKVTNLRRDHNNNDSVRIRFKVKNKGTAPVSGFRMRYVVPGTGWSPTVLSQVTLGPGQKSGDFGVGGSAVVQLPPGEHTLRIILDPDHEIAEENEGNNVASKHYNKP